MNKAEGRSTLEVFLHYFKLKNTDVTAQVVVGDNEQGVKTVAGNRHAIGYVSIGTAEYDVSQGVPIKLLPSGGVAASTETVQNSTFPISRPLHIVTGRHRSDYPRPLSTMPNPMPSMTSSHSNTLSRWPIDELVCWCLRGIAGIAGMIVLLIVIFLILEALLFSIMWVSSGSLRTHHGIQRRASITSPRCYGAPCSPWPVPYSSPLL